MSATVNSDRFSQYFYGCPSLTIPGFTHSVTEYFLPDVHQMLGGIPTAFSSPPQYKKFKSSYHFAKPRFSGKSCDGGNLQAFIKKRCKVIQ